ncbi:Cell death-inducing p53-target protein 1-like [Oopsacas minuta]|uniref:Cell death-inducing p53-target protein 1-like n=1 Tax=Oopsacas minuta TaxID=111878 RepID=A0AAV7JRI8_9METZ|nr:Cell death-inducing p53-target protein 1-like [Oopsacas minuta]
MTYQPQQQYPPPQQYPAPQQYAAPPQQTTPIAQQPLPVKVAWGDSPTPMTCTNCNTQQTSVPTKKVGCMSWIIVGVVAFVLFDLVLWPCIPCAFLALLINGLKDTHHVCPNCNHVNGVKKMV